MTTPLKYLTVDYPDIRLDEHYRSCLWCAKNEERCLRGQLLVEEVAKKQSA